VVDHHSNVILTLMARSMGDGAASTLTLAIGPATRNRTGVLTAEGHQAFYFFYHAIKQPYQLLYNFNNIYNCCCGGSNVVVVV